MSKHPMVEMDYDGGRVKVKMEKCELGVPIGQGYEWCACNSARGDSLDV